MTPLLDSAATFALALFAPLGLALFALRAWLRRAPPRLARGWWLAAALLLPLPFQWLAGRTGLELAAQALLLALLFWLLQAERRALARGLGAALLVLLAAALPLQARSAQLWLDALQPPPLTAQLRGESYLAPQPNYRAVGKAWRLDPATERVRLSFEARLASGEPGWEWYAYDPQFRLAPAVDAAGERFTRVEVPPADAPLRNISREFDTGRPLGGRTFRARLELRSPRPQRTESERQRESSGCTGAILQENGGRYRGSCEALALGPEWQAVEIDWQAPSNIAVSNIRLLLADLPDDFEVRGGTIEELRGDTWAPLAPLEPTGASVRPALPGQRRQARPSYAFTPTPSWQAHSVTLDLSDAAERESLKIDAQLEGGLGLELRGVRLESLTPGTAAPRPQPYRRSALWFPQANLAGHSVATLGLALAAVGFSGPALLGGALLALPLVLLSGSRAALAAALLGLLGLSGLLYRSWRQRALLAGLALLALGLAAPWAPNVLGRFQTFAASNEVSRPQIWARAWQAFQEHPIFGLGEDGFAAYWRVSGAPDTRVPPPHAHDLWLQFAASYGLPGLVGILLFTGGLLALAWRWGRWRGLGLAVPVLAMNVFDYTLFYAGVLYPLVLGLNALRGARLDGGAASGNNEKAGPFP